MSRVRMAFVVLLLASGIVVGAQQAIDIPIADIDIEKTCWTLAALTMTNPAASVDVAAFKRAATAIQRRYANVDCWADFFSNVTLTEPARVLSQLEFVPAAGGSGNTVHVQLPQGWTEQQLQQALDNMLQEFAVLPR